MDINNKDKIIKGGKMKLKLDLVIGAVLVLLLAGTASAISLGAGPGEVRIMNMPRGGYTKRMLSVNNLEDYDLIVSVGPGKIFEGWITFEPGSSFRLPAHSRIDFWAVVQLPEDVANGNYSGEIIVHAGPAAKFEGEGTGLVVGASISLATFIEVTGVEIVAYTIKRARAESNEIHYPIPVYVTIVNTGNVRARPIIHIDVLNENKTLIKSYEFAKVDVLPGLEEIIIINLTSEGLGVGPHFANVSTAIKGEIAGSKMVSFDVLEEGTLRLEGKLSYIMVDEGVGVGEIAKIIAPFRNMGQLPVSATFEGEVYLDGKLIETLKTEKIRVDIDKSVDFITYFTPKESGLYTVKGHVIYAEKTTDEKGTIIYVEGGASYMTYIIVAVVVVVIGAFVFLKFVRK